MLEKIKPTTAATLATIFALLTSCSDNQGSNSAEAKSVQLEPAPRSIVTVSAVQLHKAYEENEVAVDEKLKGSIARISGKVASIDKDFMDNIIINLQTTNRYNNARMQMQDSEKTQAISLRKGQNVTVDCDKVSRLLGAPSATNCVFTQQPADTK